MKTIQIDARKRTELGKTSTKNLRNEGNVPCVMYGGDKIHHFYAPDNSFLKLIYTHEANLVGIDIEGDKHTAILQEIQFHPVTDKVIHIDFMEVFEDKSVVIHVPIVLTGISAGVKEGGKLRQKRRNLKIRGFIKDLPDHLEVDITNIGIGQTIKVGELSFPDIELLDPHNSQVVSVISSRLAAKGMEMPEETAAAPAAEGEAADKSADEGAEKAEKK